MWYETYEVVLKPACAILEEVFHLLSRKEGSSSSEAVPATKGKAWLKLKHATCFKTFVLKENFIELDSYLFAVFLPLIKEMKSFSQSQHEKSCWIFAICSYYGARCFFGEKN